MRRLLRRALSKAMSTDHFNSACRDLQRAEQDKTEEERNLRFAALFGIQNFGWRSNNIATYHLPPWPRRYSVGVCGGYRWWCRRITPNLHCHARACPCNSLRSHRRKRAQSSRSHISSHLDHSPRITGRYLPFCESLPAHARTMSMETGRGGRNH